MQTARSDTFARHIGVLLAAGAGTRFGGAYPGAKLDQPLGDSTVGIQSFESLRAACDAMVVVVRDSDSALALHARSRGARVIVAATPERGLGNSLAAAAIEITALYPNAIFIWASLADMPWIDKSTYQHIRRNFDDDTDQSYRQIVQPLFVSAAGTAHERNGSTGHPVVIGRAHWRALAALEGDAGARHLIAANRDCVVRIETDDDGVWRDVDTPHDLRGGRTQP